ncbi:mannosyltransferase [Flagelloscypha sp. PMI_526]|nr:mannosyltransferase [Flagelloscypha sp. PMI_526]
MSLLTLIQKLFQHEHFILFASLCVLGDVVLTALILKFIPYTEIDWETYMVQIELYKSGERNYTSITGPTGPLVYPAGHVYIHDFLRTFTNEGLNIPRAQLVYAALYILHVSLASAIYFRAGGFPNWALVMLHASKRLHSIFVLRLFNDCWSVVVMQTSILALQSEWFYLGSILFSLALSVKMNVLLYLPAILFLTFKARGLVPLAISTSLIVAVQVFMGLPFIHDYATDYLGGAFDLSRVFLYKWTVNWRFIPEELFLDRKFAYALVIGHLTCLLLFLFFRWSKPQEVPAFVKHALSSRGLWQGVGAVTKDEITTVLFTTNLIGVLFSRSLHYQFFSWFAYQIPFLLWRTKYPIVVKLLLAALSEWAWNTFPSTTASSLSLVATNSIILVGVFYGRAVGMYTKMS